MQRTTIRTLLFLFLASFAGWFLVYRENSTSFANALDTPTTTVDFVTQIQPILNVPDPVSPVCVLTIDFTPASPFGSQRVTFTVTFSRAMDTSTAPILTFGPQAPYDQKRATLNAHWIDGTHWAVDYNVNKATGDGDWFPSKISSSDMRDIVQHGANIGGAADPDCRNGLALDCLAQCLGLVFRQMKISEERVGSEICNLLGRRVQFRL